MTRGHSKLSRVQPDIVSTTEEGFSRKGRSSAKVISISAAFLIFVIVAIVAFLPVGPFDRTTLTGGGFNDPASEVWCLAWIPYAISHGLNIFFTNRIDFPTGANLAGTTSPLLGFIASPVTVALGPTAAFNFLLRLSFAVSGFSMFLVLRTWCRFWFPALVGGLIYGFSPFMFTQSSYGHLGLIFNPIPPVLIWCIYELIILRRRNPMRIGLLLGLLAGAQMLIEPEILGLTAVVLCIGFVGFICTHLHQTKLKIPQLLPAIAVAAAGFLIVSGYFIWSLLHGPQHLHGPAQPLAVLQSYSSDLFTPIIPSSNQALTFGSMAERANSFVSANMSENGGYIGIPLLIALVGVVAMRRRNSVVLFSGVTAVIAFVCSLGPHLIVDGTNTRIPLPEAIIRHLPAAYDFVPARFSFCVILFTAIAIAGGIDASMLWIRGRSRVVVSTTWVVITIAIVAIGGTFLPKHALESVPPWPNSLTTVLNKIPENTVVLTYPFAMGGSTDEPMLWQAMSGMRFKILGGYSYVPGPLGSQWWPVSLNPPAIQSFFGEESVGQYSVYPQVPVLTRSDALQLCSLIRNYHVGAVVYFYTGIDPARVRRYLIKVLHHPSLTEGPVISVWLRPLSSCH